MKRGAHSKAEHPLKKGKKAAPSPAQDVRIRAVRMSGDDMAHVTVPVTTTTVRELRERIAEASDRGEGWRDLQLVFGSERLGEEEKTLEECGLTTTEEEHRVTVVVDTRKRFVVLGGMDKTTEILDPETMKFTLGPSLGEVRAWSAVAPLGSGEPW